MTAPWGFAEAAPAEAAGSASPFAEHDGGAAFWEGLLAPDAPAAGGAPVPLAHASAEPSAVRPADATGTNIWVPGAVRIANRRSAGGRYIGAPWRFVFHTIEGEPDADAFRALAARHDNPPHLWAAPSLDLLLQTVPLDRSAYALARPGSIQTNRANAIQVEVWGYAAKMGAATPETIRWLADRVLAPVARLVPLNLHRVTPVGPGEPCYGTASACRMTAAEWHSFDGVTGHHRVPDNKHWDPGKLDMGAIAARARITLGRANEVRLDESENFNAHDGPGFAAEREDEDQDRSESDLAVGLESGSMPTAPGLAAEPEELFEARASQRPAGCASCGSLQQESPSYTGAAAERALLASAIRAGQTDVNQLSNLVFFRRHPERNQRLISRSEPNYQQLSQEWLTIRDTLVVPALRGTVTIPAPPGTTPAPPSGAPSTGPGSGAPSTGPGTGGFQNGRIPASALCPIRTAPHQLLDCAAAQAFDRMNTAFRAQFGVDITINDAYRSYERQVEMKREKGDLAATPGTSNHGWGKAVDLGGTNNGVGAVFDWLTANATTYGWMHPPWARPGGSKPESWHWEFVGGR